MIAIIDYGAGNLCSIENVLRRIGCAYQISSDSGCISSADKVILPGVGEASDAMQKLSGCGLVQTIRSLTQPVLGICLGMQLLCSYSEEGNTPCLGIIPVRVKLLQGDSFNKVPNIGWDCIHQLKSPVFKGIDDGVFVYYVHSYGVEINEYTLCVSEHTLPFSGAIGHANFYGCQFHPEKSGQTGEQIIKNFIEL